MLGHRQGRTFDELRAARVRQLRLRRRQWRRQPNDELHEQSRRGVLVARLGRLVRLRVRAAPGSREASTRQQSRERRIPPRCRRAARSSSSRTRTIVRSHIRRSSTRTIRLSGRLRHFAARSLACVARPVVERPTRWQSNGIKEGCVSNEQSAQLLPLSSFVSYFKGLKSDPRDVLVSTIAGDSNPFEVTFTGVGGSTPLHVVHNVCMGLDPINPSVRLAQLPAMFERGSVREHLHDRPERPRSRRSRASSAACSAMRASRAIAIPADCKVFDQTPTRETELPPCSAQRTTDCYQLVEDAHARHRTTCVSTSRARRHQRPTR